MSEFAKIVGSYDVRLPLDLTQCSAPLKALVGELRERFIGQKLVCRRVVQAVLANAHVLLEGLPGEGKTTCVGHLSRKAGLRSRRVQFRPDMLASDVMGSRILALREGVAELVYVFGPIYTTLLIADEINRAPPKVQSALLQAMQEHVNSRLDRAEAELLYHPDDLAVLRGLCDSCFGVPPARLLQAAQVPFCVFATQNPIEQEGVYPLPEAQLDRFLFKLLVRRPAVEHGTEILERNLLGDSEAEGAAAEPDGPPLWVRAVCLLQRARDLLWAGPDSAVSRFMREQRGLWDRVRLVVHLSHHRLIRRPEWEADEGLSATLRDREQESLAAWVSDWLHSDRARRAGDLGRRVRAMLEHRLFEYVEAGLSTRGLLAWPPAAAAEALLRDGLKEGVLRLRRKHFRAVAEDLFRHRLRLTPQARADGVHSEDVIALLLDTLLPAGGNEEAEDALPLLPDEAPNEAELDD